MGRSLPASVLVLSAGLCSRAFFSDPAVIGFYASLTLPFYAALILVLFGISLIMSVDIRAPFYIVIVAAIVGLCMMFFCMATTFDGNAHRKVTAVHSRVMVVSLSDSKY